MGNECTGCGLVSENRSLRQEIDRLRREIEKQRKQIEELQKIVRKLQRIIERLKEIIREARRHAYNLYTEAAKVTSRPSGVPRGTWSMAKGRAAVAQIMYHKLPEVD